MPEPDTENPPISAEPEPPASAPTIEKPESRQDATKATRVYFLVAEGSEGPSAPIDAYVTTRRARRAMEKLLGEREAAAGG